VSNRKQKMGLNRRAHDSLLEGYKFTVSAKYKGLRYLGLYGDRTGRGCFFRVVTTVAYHCLKSARLRGHLTGRFLAGFNPFEIPYKGDT
jgi:hypothetical protein